MKSLHFLLIGSQAGTRPRAATSIPDTSVLSNHPHSSLFPLYARRDAVLARWRLKEEAGMTQRTPAVLRGAAASPVLPPESLWAQTQVLVFEP